MGEMVAWSRDAGIGTPKHPPLAAWLVRRVVHGLSAADWAYYVFAMVLATFALWVAWRVSERYLDGEKRVAGLLLLTFIPFFNFHALKYNANTVLIPLWALTTWLFPAFLRDAQRGLGGARRAAAAAAAMMGKYWSIFLLAGLGIAALADPRRAQYFRSAAPWVTIAVGAILFAPHVAWIVAHDFAPFTYAVVAHQSTLASSASVGLGFLAGSRAIWRRRSSSRAIITRPSLAALADTLWPHEPGRRFALIAFIAPLLLPALAAMLAKVEIVSLWAMSAMTLLPVVLLSSPLVTVTRARRHVAARRRDRVSGADGARRAVHRDLDPPRRRAELRDALPPARRTRSTGSGTRRQTRRCASSAATPTSSMACRSICRTAVDARHRRPALDAVGRRRERRARRHRAGLPGGGSGLHAVPQPARRRACRATRLRCRAAIGASPTSRCAM